MGEQKQTENVEKPLDDNAYHVLAMTLAPLITESYQDTRKRSEVKLNPLGGFPVRLINGIVIHVEPIEFGRTEDRAGTGREGLMAVIAEPSLVMVLPSVPLDMNSMAVGTFVEGPCRHAPDIERRHTERPVSEGNCTIDPEPDL